MVSSYKYIIGMRTNNSEMMTAFKFLYFAGSAIAICSTRVITKPAMRDVNNVIMVTAVLERSMFVRDRARNTGKEINTKFTIGSA